MLYLLSVEINKVLGLQNCWFGDLDDAGWGWGGVGRVPAAARAGSPGLSRRSPGPRAHAVPRQLRPSAGSPARGRSSGPRPRSTARAAAVARRAETTKDGPWVTPARGSGRGPPTRKRQSTAGEPGAPRRAARGGAGRSSRGGLRRAGDATRGREHTATWNHDGHGHHSENTTGSTHTAPGRYTLRAAAFGSPGRPPAAAGDRMRGPWCWGEEHELVAFMWEMNTSLPGVGRPRRALNECAVNQMHTKEIWIMEIHSYCSHLKCLRVWVTNSPGQPVLN